ncbi:Hsp70 family protein, partial [Betaproteobacteria bacterium]|nr:Hsp70 family protein [Betaproteobacteria bacterium]
MALLQISEPDSLELTPTKELKAVIGIDLGTTNSLVGYVDGQDTTVKICLDENGQALIKSAVTYRTGHIPRVGNHKVREVEKGARKQVQQPS